MLFDRLSPLAQTSANEITIGVTYPLLKDAWAAKLVDVPNQWVAGQHQMVVPHAAEAIAHAVVLQMGSSAVDDNIFIITDVLDHLVTLGTKEFKATSEAAMRILAVEILRNNQVVFLHRDLYPHLSKLQSKTWRIPIPHCTMPPDPLQLVLFFRDSDPHLDNR